MKTNQFSLFLAGLMLALLTTLPNAARAQVKIGTNHNTIGPSSNLEVEAANGNKVTIDKTTGAVSVSGTFAGDPLQVTGVKEGQTSAAQTLMITADGYVQKAPAAVSLQTRFIASANQNPSQTYTGPTPPPYITIDLSSIDFESYPGSVDLTNNLIKVPRDGYYQVNGTLGVTDAPAGQTISTCIYYKRNTTYIGENCIRSHTNGRQSGSFSIVLYLNANDTISAVLANSFANTLTSKGVTSPSMLQVIELR
ncbi:hypothetical protein [uncultured Fibrella sp.]|uniref:hypothetical protein n=1 Tax=uncultured Fibrella sp. TaxID=1284596 RepID=UPI0035CBF66F